MTASGVRIACIVVLFFSFHPPFHSSLSSNPTHRHLLVSIQSQGIHPRMTHFPSTVVPPNVSEAGEDSSTEIDTHESEAEAFELSQYDIDVVEDALDNPDSSEFRDHFGFTIKVETDNEITSSESEQESDTESHYSTTTAERRATSSKSDASKVAWIDTNSLSSDEDTNNSMDTVITTPTQQKTLQESAPIVSITTAEETKDTPQVTPQATSGRRARSGTVSVAPALEIPALEIPTQEVSAAITPLSTLNVLSVLAIEQHHTTSTLYGTLPPDPTLLHQQMDKAIQPKKSLHTRSRSAQPALPTPGESISRKRSNSLTSTTTSLRTSTSTRPSSQIERPSQVYQERQNKRHSEIYKTEASSSLPSSLTTGPSYYEMLKAKFGMASHDTRTRESPKQLALKEETTSSLEHWKEKNDDYDWEFWASLIPGLEESARTNPQRLHEHLATGIPPPLRGMLWQIFSKSRDTSELENEYRELLKRTSPHEKLIRRDLTRTFPTHTFFQDKEGQGQEMLFHVIKAYSLFDTQVGYCQGLPFVVGCLLLHMPDEAAFCVLIKLMSHYGLRGHFTPQMETLHERMYQFNQLLLHFLPQVHRHLDTQGIKPSMYASQWFMTMFAYRCPLELTFRVFDVVFVEGACILLNFALALMKKNQQTLLSLDFESLLDFFHHGVYDVYENDAGTFVRDAYQFDISPRQLAKFSKKYASDTAKEAKLHSQEEQLRRANADLLEQLRQLEHAYDALQEDHQAIAQQVLTANLEMSHMKEENQSLSQKLSQIQQERGHPVPVSMDRESQRVFDELAKKNALLVDRNSQLEDRLSEVESVLIDFKLKYAQSQTEHETLRQQWQEGQRRSRHLLEE